MLDMDSVMPLVPAVIRESISLAVLFVFLFFSYKLLDRSLGLLEQFASSALEALDKIADAIES